MQNGNIFVSELSTSRHSFKNYHFCRGNSNKRKSRLGLILKGSGSYIYLGKRLSVSVGDVVFIPENIYCYSEWHGEPDIEVVYLSCFMHYKDFRYEPQIIGCSDDEKKAILNKFISERGITRKDITTYAPFFPDNAMRTLIESEVIYSVAQ